MVGISTIVDAVRRGRHNRKTRKGQERVSRLVKSVQAGWENQYDEFLRIEPRVSVYHSDDLKTEVSLAGFKDTGGSISVYALQIRKDVSQFFQRGEDGEFEPDSEEIFLPAVRFFRYLDPDSHRYFLGGHVQDYRGRSQWVIGNAPHDRSETGNLVRPVELWRGKKGEGELIYKPPFRGSPPYFDSSKDLERASNF